MCCGLLTLLAAGKALKTNEIRQLCSTQKLRCRNSNRWETNSSCSLLEKEQCLSASLINRNCESARCKDLGPGECRTKHHPPAHSLAWGLRRHLQRSPVLSVFTDSLAGAALLPLWCCLQAEKTRLEAKTPSSRNV